MCPEFDALMSDTAETCRAASVGYTVRATSFTGTSTNEGCTGACRSWVIVKSLEVWFLDEGWSWRRHEYGQMQQITVGQLGFRERESEREREREREMGGIASKFEVIKICWENDIWDVGEDLFRSVCHCQLTLLCRFSWGAYAGYTVRATSFTGTSTDEGCTGACWSWVIVKSLEVWFLDEGWSWRRHEYGQMQQITVGQLGLREREREKGRKGEKGREREREILERERERGWHCFEVRSDQNMLREWYMRCWWRPVQICLPLSVDSACRFSWGAYAGYTVRATSCTGTSTDEGCTGACRSWVIVKSLEVWFLDEGRSSRRHEYGQMQQITMGQLGFRKRERERERERERKGERERERERGGIASKFEVIKICWENDIWDVGEDLFRSVCHCQLTLLADSVEVPMQATLSEPPASLEPPPMRAAQVLVEAESQCKAWRYDSLMRVGVGDAMNMDKCNK